MTTSTTPTDPATATESVPAPDAAPSTRPEVSPTDTVSVRLKLSALWTSVLFVFAYVDLFSFYRADVRAEIATGEIAGFTIGEGFLLATTAYVLVPSLMVFLSLVLPRRVARPTTIVLAVVYAATIVGSAVGEWGYFMLGSAVEVALLSTMVVLARRWSND